MTTTHMMLAYMSIIIVIAILYQILLFKTRKCLHEALRQLEGCRDRVETLLGLVENFDRHATDGKALLLHNADNHSFLVVRDSMTIKRVFYNPDDPDDYDYKRNHAEEIADILNEQP